MARISLDIQEIEHSQDLENARQAIVKAGGEIISQQPDFDDGYCIFIVDIGDKKRDEFEQRVENIIAGKE